MEWAFHLSRAAAKTIIGDITSWCNSMMEAGKYRETPGALERWLPIRYRVLPCLDVVVSRVLRILVQTGLMEERRATQRHRVFKVGSIEFDGRAVDCTVRNISPLGAALEVATTVGIPHEFTLKMPTSNTCANCHVVWRKEKHIGLAFERAA